MCVNKAFFVGPKIYHLTFIVFKFFGIFDIKKYREEVLSKMKGDILDVAISDAGNYSYYTKADSVIVLDNDQKIIDYAKENNKDVRFDFQLGDAEDLSQIPDESVDNFVSIFLYSCGLYDPIKAYKEAHRVLKKGGKLTLVCHVPSKKWYMKPVEFLMDNIVRIIAAPEKPVPVEGDIEEAGFTILEDYIPGAFDIAQCIVAKK